MERLCRVIQGAVTPSAIRLLIPFDTRAFTRSTAAEMSVDGLTGRATATTVKEPLVRPLQYPIKPIVLVAHAQLSGLKQPHRIENL
jgi:hypothetical protein